MDTNPISGHVNQNVSPLIDAGKFSTETGALPIAKKVKSCAFFAFQNLACKSTADLSGRKFLPDMED